MTWAGETRWDARQALAEITRDGYAGRLPELAERAAVAAQPADAGWLTDRLSFMWLANGTGGASEKRATAWLHEMQRLLADVPADILGQAMDAAVLASEKGFLPSVGAIRALADPPLRKRQEMARRLRLLADMPPVAPAPPQPKARSEGPHEQITPEQAAAIMEEFGIRPDALPAAVRHLGERRKPTDADYRELMGAEAFAAWKGAAADSGA